MNIPRKLKLWRHLDVRKSTQALIFRQVWSFLCLNIAVLRISNQEAWAVLCLLLLWLRWNGRRSTSRWLLQPNWHLIIQLVRVARCFCQLMVCRLLVEGIVHGHFGVAHNIVLKWLLSGKVNRGLAALFVLVSAGVQPLLSPQNRQPALIFDFGG